MAESLHLEQQFIAPDRLGVCYLISSYSFFFAPDLPLAADAIWGCLIGEGALALWLLIIGVNEPAWRAAAAS